jgi:NADH-quinone oxidoreductase subunit F
MSRITDISSFNAVEKAGMARLLPATPRVTVGMGTCGRGNGAEGLYHALAEEISSRGFSVQLVSVGCFGPCSEEPVVGIWVPGRPLVLLRRVQASDAERIISDLMENRVTPDLAWCKVEEWDHITAQVRYGHGYPELPSWHEVPFFKGQKKIVLRNCGLINPDDIEEYIGVGGYQALYKVLIDGQPEAVIERIRTSKLRGRGGAGYLTGIKWEFMAKANSGAKYLICNADEGDPGAYMNRNEIESDPHSLLEGMIIGGYVMGAEHGIVYVRAEYPLAVHRLNVAIERAREYGLLGDNILGRGFHFDIEVVEGAGAFVCGEETALIASLEGFSGRPRPRPPFPAQRGLWGRPTNINNVETWYNIVPIVLKGPAWFTETGSTKSAGTKVFSLVGKVQSTGLVEMPLGTPLKAFVYDIGGGAAAGKTVKAVQTGGPSGGCIPQELFGTAVDYETLGQIGSIMGSGGMVVMDEDNCMVDVARYFVEFTHSESCGKCIPCRVGLDRSLEILNGFTEGNGAIGQIEMLTELGRMIRDTSLCGLGQTAPNPVLTTMRHFREEFEEHIIARRCDAGVCSNLALSPCENSCPLHMNIPRFLELFKEGRLEDAFESVVMDNPLPASTGRVCQHPCEHRCRRQTIDEPINMREVHRLIADSIYGSDRLDPMIQRVVSRKLPETGFRVAVAGAGPTGLTAAFYLALLGHDVTVFESKDKPGGMLRYALPEYRLPKAILDREIELIQRTGVKFATRTRVASDISLNDLDSQFDAVFLSTGTWKESWLNIPGTELNGVFPALTLLDSVASQEQHLLGRRVVVIGGGNAAIDSARTALRFGSDVTVVYRRERRDMPAIAEETLAAEHEGAKFLFLAAPHRIIGDDQKNVKGFEVERTRLGEYDTSGRRKPVPTGEIVRIDCDSVVLAIGEGFDLDFCRASGLRLKDSGNIVVDRFTLETSRKKFYAGGDLVTGSSNVSHAMAYGKQVAQSIDRRLVGRDRFEALFRSLEYDQTVPLHPVAVKRCRSQELPPSMRVHGYDEVVLGLTNIQAVEESSRCLRCDVRV